MTEAQILIVAFWLGGLATAGAVLAVAYLPCQLTLTESLDQIREAWKDLKSELRQSVRWLMGWRTAATKIVITCPHCGATWNDGDPIPLQCRYSVAIRTRMKGGHR